MGGERAVEKLTTELRNIEMTLNRGLQASSRQAAVAAYSYGNYIRECGLGDSGLLDRARDVAQANGDVRLAADCAARAADIALSRFDHPRASEQYEQARGAYHGLAMVQARGVACATWASSPCARESGAPLKRYSTRRGRSRGTPPTHLEKPTASSGSAISHRRWRIPQQLGAISRTRWPVMGSSITRARQNCWLSLGELALDEGDKVRAELYIQKALDLHRSAGHYLGV